MRILRPASVDEYVSWYLTREVHEEKALPDPAVMSTVAAMRRTMDESHQDKMRPWFGCPTARWHVVSLDEMQDLGTLIFLDAPWTRKANLIKETGKDRRLLNTVIKNAGAERFFGNREVLGITEDAEKTRKKYYTRFHAAWPMLRAIDRVILCTPNDAERLGSPDGTYYLHDGMGRLLAYYYMIMHEGRHFRPVEAFLAEEGQR